MRKLTENGIATTEKGESFERFSYRGKTFFQYDYRAKDGKLFSCVCKTLEECRVKRNQFIYQKYTT